MTYDIPQRKQWIGYAAPVSICAILFGMACAGAWLLYMAVMADDTVGLGLRLTVVALAAICLFVPGLAVWSLLRRKWKTGRFRLSPEERAKLRAKNLAGSKASRLQSSKPWQIFADLVSPVLYTEITVQHFHRSHSSWMLLVMLVVASFWWIYAGLGIHRTVRRPSKPAVISR